MSDINPTLTQVLETAITGFLDDLRVAAAGRIESYNASSRRAVVQVLPMDAHINGASERKTTTIPPLTDVPVMQWGAGGGMRIKVTPELGDQCLLVVSSSSIARLKATGTIAPYDPGDDRHHVLADAIAIPCVVVGSGVEGKPLIAFDDAVRLGSESAAEAVPRGSTYIPRVDALLGKIVDALDKLQAAAPTLGGSPGQISDYTAAMTALDAELVTFTSAASSYLSDVVKVP